ncbi:MAG: extradiol ring-cleavage dioxygenase [Nitrososphaerota archaeon]|nr:extradiol ring-cleavage dioxygenase [Nitrososphaerota archaeon]
MPLVYACIAPHGSEVVPALAGTKSARFSQTRAGMRKLAEEIKEARPDTVVVATPHNLRLHRHIGVVTAENSSGVLREAGREIRLRARCDVEFAERLVLTAEGQGLPVVGAAYGVNEGPLSDMAMDWGTLVPLWFLVRGTRLRSKIVIVTPSRGIPLYQDFEFGKVIARVAEAQTKRTAFIASSDQAHAHKKGGPYGYSPAAAEYDSLVVDAVRKNRLESVLEVRASLVDKAKPDSLWQMAMLAGALSVVPIEGRLHSYQVPTYFGMLCAGYPRRPKTSSSPAILRQSVAP